MQPQDDRSEAATQLVPPGGLSVLAMDNGAGGSDWQTISYRTNDM